MVRKLPVSEQRLTENRLTFLGLLGMSVIAVLQLITCDNMDNSLIVAAVAFSLAVPFLTVDAIIVHMEAVLKKTLAKDPPIQIFTQFGGVLASVVGLNAIFWHFDWRIGVLFLLCCLLAIVEFVIIYGLLTGPEDPPDSPPQPVYPPPEPPAKEPRFDLE
jgi:hypothetical protein